MEDLIERRINFVGRFRCIEHALSICNNININNNTLKLTQSWFREADEFEIIVKSQLQMIQS